MRVLLDECLPKRLKSHLGNHEVFTVPEMGWAGKKNGELLQLGASHFQVFLTTDQNLSYQQNLRQSSLGILVLKAKSNSLPDLLPLVPAILQRLSDTAPGELITISG